MIDLLRPVTLTITRYHDTDTVTRSFTYTRVEAAMVELPTEWDAIGDGPAQAVAANGDCFQLTLAYTDEAHIEQFDPATGAVITRITLYGEEPTP